MTTAVAGDIHPTCEQRLATWRQGMPFPCHRCGTGDALEQRLICADCKEKAQTVARNREIVSRTMKIVPQFDLFGG